MRAREVIVIIALLSMGSISLGFTLSVPVQAWTVAGTSVNSLNLKQYPQYAYNNTFVFSPKSLTWKAYNSKGKVIKSGRASGGASYCRDVKRACRTPVGSFKIISKGPASCKSSRYPLNGGGAKMPYCMFFSKYYAIHGSYDLPRRNASHGCVRVSPSSARWLSKHFIRIGTRVVILPY
jgi:hypothetical protein